jgi:hypothetical protein
VTHSQATQAFSRPKYPWTIGFDLARIKVPCLCPGSFIGALTMPSHVVTRWAPRVGLGAAREKQKGLRLIGATFPLTVIGVTLFALGLIHAGAPGAVPGAVLVLCSMTCFVLSLWSARRFQVIAGKKLGIDTRKQNFIPPQHTRYLEWCQRNGVLPERFAADL